MNVMSHAVLKLKEGLSGNGHLNLRFFPTMQTIFLKSFRFFAHISTYVELNRTKSTSLKRALKDESIEPSCVKIGLRVVRQWSSKGALFPYHANHFWTYFSFFAHISTYV